MAYLMTLTHWTQLGPCLAEKGVTYYFPEGRNDGFIFKTGTPDGLSKFHVHSIEKAEGDQMVFSHLLAKSGNWRGGAEPDLAQLPIAQWMSACQGMDSATLFAVDALARCFTSLGAKQA